MLGEIEQVIQPNAKHGEMNSSMADRQLKVKKAVSKTRPFCICNPRKGVGIANYSPLQLA